MRFRISTRLASARTRISRTVRPSSGFNVTSIPPSRSPATARPSKSSAHAAARSRPKSARSDSGNAARIRFKLASHAAVELQSTRSDSTPPPHPAATQTATAAKTRIDRNA